MINWLTNYIGTCSFLKIAGSNNDFEVVDVRNLVDKDGNTPEAILSKIDEALNLLHQKQKVVVCCDYGMSRSNSIAAGVISKYESIPFSKAVQLVQQKISEQGVKLEVLNDIYLALNSSEPKKENETERILITGASGFIGKKLTEKLEAKYFVKGLSGKEVDLIQNPVFLDLLVKENDISTLVHLANPRIYTVNVAMGDSLVMLKNVLEICRLNNLRLIYVSSWEVYSGYRADELVADEKLPLFPKGSYGESKWLCEELIQHYHKIYGLKYIILRSSPIYGEFSDKPKFIYNFIDRARKNEEIITHKYLNGFPKVDLLYLDDFVSALEKSINFRGTEIFNLGSGKLLTTRRIAEIIVNSLGSTSEINFTQINNYYPNLVMDYSKSSNLLKWHPQNFFESFVSKLK